MVFVNVKFGKIFMICFDDDFDDGEIVIGGKLGVKYVDIEKGVYNDKGEEYLVLLWNVRLFWGDNWFLVKYIWNKIIWVCLFLLVLMSLCIDILIILSYDIYLLIIFF